MNTWENIYIGTSGWNYDHWKGPFYPRRTSKKDYLSYYADRFPTVEIDHSFSQSWNKETLMGWYNAVGPGFTFTVRSSRYITYTKKLRDAGRTVKSLISDVEVLKDKLGPILFQLPPRWDYNEERFYDFLEALPDGHRYAVEFCDPSWLNESAYEAMREIGVALCVHEINAWTSPKEITADFLYVRLHGPVGLHQSRHDVHVLGGWAGAFSVWAGQGRDIFCYFENDQAGYAAKDALRLQAMLDKAD